ncbi:hypothetical protein BGZ63DRAFT_394376 [Mariannaea sp. PMI_226]|nr:hypothetical protein BGZ63DRAFT_394376 [Mariannaea sp. PMI_226]
MHFCDLPVSSISAPFVQVQYGTKDFCPLQQHRRRFSHSNPFSSFCIHAPGMIQPPPPTPQCYTIFVEGAEEQRSKSGERGDLLWTTTTAAWLANLTISTDQGGNGVPCLNMSHGSWEYLWSMSSTPGRYTVEKCIETLKQLGNPLDPVRD